MSEVILLNTRAEVFWRFLQVRLESDVDSLPESEATDFQDALKADVIEKSELCRTMQEVMGYYVLMEEYFMRISVAKAEALDSIDEELTQATSSMVRFFTSILLLLSHTIAHFISSTPVSFHFVLRSMMFSSSSRNV